MIEIPIWLFITLILANLILPAAALFWGTWVTFRSKFAGTGYSFKPPSTPKTGEKTASYVTGLFDDLRDRKILEEEPLSPAAKRIRAQYVQTEEDTVIAEVEGLTK